VIVGHSLWTANAMSSAKLNTLPRQSPTATIQQSQTDSPARETEAPPIDRFGNDVEAAIGDYRIDGRGDIYERHSPNTEIAHLSAPVL